jgi:hypothetical protein
MVVIDKDTRLSGLQSVKYVVLYGSVSTNVGYSFAEYKDLNFRDWKSADGIGVDAYAYLITGDVIAGASSAQKQMPYIVTHMLRTEENVELINGALNPSKQSSCLMSPIWQWSLNSKSNKIGQAQQIYRYRKPLFIEDAADTYDNGMKIVSAKSKLRGRGQSVSLKFETEPSKDCRLLGWSLSLTMNKF